MSHSKRVFEPFSEWTTSFCQHDGFFDHLKTLFGFHKWNNFPSADDLNLLLDATPQVYTLSGQPVRFVPQDDVDFMDRAYEAVIYQTGQVPTRDNNWHDMFGAFIWCLFPKTKSLLNHLHYQDILAHGDKKRTATRNAITLLDECGVVLAISDAEFKARIRAHDWQWSFLDNRERWGTDILPFIIGHANYEMLTKPYIGLTGKALFVEVDREFARFPLARQYALLDNQLAQSIVDSDLLKDNSHLSPLPLLGVPGWFDGNTDPAFYDNRQYFRPKPQRRVQGDQ